MSNLEREVDILSEDDIEAVEEAAMPTNPKEEQASVDSVKKASDQTKRAKQLKGSKTVTDEPADSKGKNFKNKMWEDADFGEDLNALVESEATLSEGFKDKAAVIFESALQMKLAEEVERLEESYEEQLSESVEVIKVDLEEKVNAYLSYVVESWMEENEVGVEQVVRTEIAEGFMEGLKQLFVESYIDVPESKVDIVDELADKLVDLEEQLNDAIGDNIELKEALLTSQKEAILYEAFDGLSITQAEKLGRLVEGVEAGDVETFERKVNTIKNAYFSEDVVNNSMVITEETEVEATETDEVDHSPEMSSYMQSIYNTLSRTLK